MCSIRVSLGGVKLSRELRRCPSRTLPVDTKVVAVMLLYALLPLLRLLV